MNKKIKLALMFCVSALSVLVGFTDVKAATLVQTPIDNVYYTRRGGGKPYMSAQYNTYDMDGKTVYCIEPGVDITTHSYNGATGWINSPYSDEINRKIELYGYYGYEYPGHDTVNYHIATQALIWERMKNMDPDTLINQEEVYSELGITQNDIDNFDEVEFE